jgi:NTP pyrophosphatase (non-canonical NTP hydrolase)
VEPINDRVTHVGDLTAAVEAFYTARNWRRFHSPKNLAMAIAIEAAELMELFQWMDNDEAVAQARSGPLRERLEEELADVLIYGLTLASTLDVDISAIVTRKLEANGRKYPVGSAPRLYPGSPAQDDTGS